MHCQYFFLTFLKILHDKRIDILSLNCYNSFGGENIVNNRLKQVRLALKLSQRNFGNLIGLAGSTINDIEHGKYNLPDRIAFLICYKCNVNEEWFFKGNGEMFNTEDKLYKEFFNIYKSLSPACQDFLLKTARHLLELQQDL